MEGKDIPTSLSPLEAVALDTVRNSSSVASITVKNDTLYPSNSSVIPAMTVFSSSNLGDPPTTFKLAPSTDANGTTNLSTTLVSLSSINTLNDARKDMADHPTGVQLNTSGTDTSSSSLALPTPASATTATTEIIGNPSLPIPDKEGIPSTSSASSDRTLTATQLENILTASQSRWLNSNEVYKLLHSFRRYLSFLTVHSLPQTLPPSGTLLLYAPGVKVRQDGYVWSRKIDSEGYSVLKEHHVKLLVGGTRVMTCYYSQREDTPNFCRRIYWLLDSEFPNLRKNPNSTNGGKGSIPSSTVTNTHGTDTTGKSITNSILGVKRTTSMGGNNSSNPQQNSNDNVNLFIENLKNAPLPSDMHEIDDVIRGIVLVHYLNPAPSSSLSSHAKSSSKVPKSLTNNTTTLLSSLSPSQVDSVVPSGRTSPGATGSTVNESTDPSTSQRVIRRSNKRTITSVTNPTQETIPDHETSVNGENISSTDTFMINSTNVMDADSTANTSISINDGEFLQPTGDGHVIEETIVTTPTNKLRKYSDIESTNVTITTVTTNSANGSAVKTDSKTKKKLNRPLGTVKPVPAHGFSSNTSPTNTVTASSHKTQSSLAPGISEPQRNIPLRRLLPPDTIPALLPVASSNNSSNPTFTQSTNNNPKSLLSDYNSSNDTLMPIFSQANSNLKFSLPRDTSSPLSSPSLPNDGSNLLRYAKPLSSTDSFTDWNNGKDFLSSMVPSHDDASFDFIAHTDSLDAFFTSVVTSTPFTSMNSSSFPSGVDTQGSTSFGVSQVIPGLLDEDEDQNMNTDAMGGRKGSISKEGQPVPPSNKSIDPLPILSTDTSTMGPSTSVSLDRRTNDETVYSVATVVSNHEYVDIEDEYEEDNDDDENVPFADVENLENKTDKLLSRVADQLAQLSGVLPQSTITNNPTTNSTGQASKGINTGTNTKIRSSSIGANITNPHNALPSLVDPTTGQSLLHCAVLSSNYFFTQTLLQMGSNPNVVDYAGRTCLQIAIQSKDTKMVELLRKYDSSVMVTTDDKPFVPSESYSTTNYDTTSIHLPFPVSPLGTSTVGSSSSFPKPMHHHPFGSSSNVPSASLTLALVQPPSSSSSFASPTQRKRGLSTADRHALVESFAALSLREKCAVAKVLDNPIIDDNEENSPMDNAEYDNDGDNHTNRYSDIHTNDDDRNTVSSISSVATREYLDRRRLHHNGSTHPPGDNLSTNNDDSLSLAPPDAASVAHAINLMSSDELFDLEMEAKVIQSGVRAWLIRRNYLHLRQATRALQGAIRQMIHRRRSRLSQQKDTKESTVGRDDSDGKNTNGTGGDGMVASTENVEMVLTSGSLPQNEKNSRTNYPPVISSSISSLGGAHENSKVNDITVTGARLLSPSGTVNTATNMKTPNAGNENISVENTFELERSRRQADAAAVIARSIKRWYNH